MTTVDIPIEPKVEHLLNSVKQLTPVELDEFMQKFTEWQQQKDISIDRELDADASDDHVVAYIKENLKLPDQENRRYWQLRRKSEDESLTEDELPEYQELVRQLTILNTIGSNLG